MHLLDEKIIPVESIAVEHERGPHTLVVVTRVEGWRTTYDLKAHTYGKESAWLLRFTFEQNPQSRSQRADDLRNRLIEYARAHRLTMEGRDDWPGMADRDVESGIWTATTNCYSEEEASRQEALKLRRQIEEQLAYKARESAAKEAREVILTRYGRYIDLLERAARLLKDRADKELDRNADELDGYALTLANDIGISPLIMREERASMVPNTGHLRSFDSYRDYVRREERLSEDDLHVIRQLLKGDE